MGLISGHSRLPAASLLSATKPLAISRCSGVNTWPSAWEPGMEQIQAPGSKCLVLVRIGGVGLADLPRLLVGQAELVSHSLKPIRHGLAQLLEIRTETSLFLCPDHVDRTQRQGGDAQVRSTVAFSCS